MNELRYNPERVSTPELAKESHWYKNAVIYSVRVPAFYDSTGSGIGDLLGLTEKLPYLQDLGVTVLWLLPFYPSPLKDDGYDIADFTDVHPDLGKIDDFKGFLKEAHARGMRVITELVLNHTSDEHAWFQRARRAKPGSVERDFYVWSETAEKYREARIIFKDFERSNWTWDPVAKAYYWHRFFSHQPDLNYDNPAVKKAMFKVVNFWLSMGVDGLRLDAVPYLFEREGTNCENLPETFAFLEELRRYVDERFQDRMLLAEANQWPEDAVRYLEGGNKCHMAFHFPLMPRMFMALHMEERYPISEILSQTPALPETCQWGMFLRNHDELTLEMVTDEERDYMYEAYARDPRARINLGIRRRLAPLMNNSRSRIELLNLLLFSMPGTPILYYGDEIGMGDNVHLGDRNGVRTPMQWSADRNAGFSRANPQRLYLPVIVDPEYHYESVNVETQQGNPSSLLWWTKRLIALRKQYKVLGSGTCTFLEPGNPKVLAFMRELDEQRILVVANLSRFTQYVELDLSEYQGLVPIELFGRTPFPAISTAPMVLTPGPHWAIWFSLEPPVNDGGAFDRRPALPEITTGMSWPKWLDREPSKLERILPEFLQECRWFGGKGRVVKQVSILEVVPMNLGASVASWLLTSVAYDEGQEEQYFIPLAYLPAGDPELEKLPGAVLCRTRRISSEAAEEGLLVDAFQVDSFRAFLWRWFEKRYPLKGGRSEVTPQACRWFKKEGHVPELEPRLLTGEQSNTSLAFGDRYIMKVYRRAAAGLNPDLEVGRFLTERAQFTHTPRVAGWLEFRRDREAVRTLAVLHEFVPESRDAWRYVREEVARYFERVMAIGPSEVVLSFRRPLLELVGSELPEPMAEALGTFLASVELMGRRTAELHLALASDAENPTFAPEPYGSLYQRSIHQSMRNLAQTVLRQMRRALPKLPALAAQEASALLAQERALLGLFEEFRKTKVHVMRIRNHGDFHLGQMLYTGKDFHIIDFEGEPARSLSERTRKRSALRDVASMLRSFHYAVALTLLEQIELGTLGGLGEQQLEIWADAWHRAVSSAFLRSYLDTADEAPFVPKAREELRVLLDVFLVEKALYEIGYELNNRPGWLRIPLRGIRDILGETRHGN